MKQKRLCVTFFVLLSLIVIAIIFEICLPHPQFYIAGLIGFILLFPCEIVRNKAAKCGVFNALREGKKLK